MDTILEFPEFPLGRAQRSLFEFLVGDGICIGWLDAQSGSPAPESLRCGRGLRPTNATQHPLAHDSGKPDFYERAPEPDVDATSVDRF